MTLSNDLATLSELTRDLHDEVLDRLAGGDTPGTDAPRIDANGTWPHLARRYVHQTGIESPEHFADAIAQSITCTCFAIRASMPERLSSTARQWLVAQAEPIVRQVFDECRLFEGNGQVKSDRHDNPSDHGEPLLMAGRIRQFLDRRTVRSLCMSLSDEPGESNLPTHFYEQFLQSYDSGTRRRRGVFYTPESLVTFVVSNVDRILRDEFNLAEGLLDRATWQEMAGHSSTSPFVRLLDPAMGSGVFLLEVVRHAHRQLTKSHRQKPSELVTQTNAWNNCVEQFLLPRICGLELMLPPLILAQIQMAVQLAETGYRFERPGKLRFYLADTLRQPMIQDLQVGLASAPFSIVIGNPPFSGISSNRQPWIRNLLRGCAPDGASRGHTTPGGTTAVANYFQVDGQPLGERKHWLEDDYVKFMRFAHWQIEMAGMGVIGLVTNHAYLDNSTFRGMRQQLTRSFPKMTLVDLHGNKRRGDRSRNGGPPDEGVFPIEQGVSISLLRRPPGHCNPVNLEVEYVPLHGSKSEKLARLDAANCKRLNATRLRPQSPHFLFVPHDDRGREQYEQGHRLVDIMPVNSTAAVTARDPFVVAFNEQELRIRIELFRDRQLNDQQIRDRFFTGTRSSRYQPGDTRGWRLSEARQKMSACSDWPNFICECAYRPFDRRVVFWADWMIDWPRNRVMQHLLDGNNLALIARRQTPPSQPCCYFWVTDTIALDGLIRSDNRGSESVFPLFLDGVQQRLDTDASRPDDSAQLASGATRRANFATDFIESCERRLGLHWRQSGSAGAPDQFGPEDLLHYIYALFHAPIYRERCAAWLRLDFPRVFICHQVDLFRQLANCGAKLLEAHTLRSTRQSNRRIAGLERSAVIQPGYPKFDGSEIWINREACFESVPEEIWRFQIGTYQVCRKWLRDRRGRTLTEMEADQYGRLLDAVELSLGMMNEIDQQIQRHGGWTASFGS